MTTEEIIEFIKSEHQRLMNFYQIKDKTQATHPIMIKISEEVGELAEEVLLLNRKAPPSSKLLGCLEV